MEAWSWWRPGAGGGLEQVEVMTSQHRIRAIRVSGPISLIKTIRTSELPGADVDPGVGGGLGQVGPWNRWRPGASGGHD